MPARLRIALCLGLFPTLVGLAGCSSGGTVPQRSEPSPTTAVAPPPPAENYIATLTLEADSAPLYAEPSTSSPVLVTLLSGEHLSLIQRTAEWLQVRAASGAIGFIQPSALVAATCTTDRAEPHILEVPAFSFTEGGLRGNVVIEAEFDAEARIINSRVLENSFGNPAFERQALADLQRVRFLPPTKDCKPRPFFYTFTRQF